MCGGGRGEGAGLVARGHVCGQRGIYISVVCTDPGIIVGGSVGWCAGVGDGDWEVAMGAVLGRPLPI